jgi:GTP-binding nuclear protein Ran
MFDVCSRISYQNVSCWYKDIIRNCPDIPIVLVGNKIDNVSLRKIKPYQINFHRKHCLKYIEISAKANYNYEEVYLSLIRLLEKDEELYIIKGPQLNDAIINVDEYVLKCYKKVLEALEKEDLEISDDDF